MTKHHADQDNAAHRAYLHELIAHADATQRAYGWTVMNVFPTLKEPGLPFSYTAGMSRLGMPDLFMLYTKPDTAILAGTVVNMVASRMREYGGPVPGPLALEVADELTVHVTVEPTTSPVTLGKMTMARHLSPLGVFSALLIDAFAPADWEDRLG